MLARREGTGDFLRRSGQQLLLRFGDLGGMDAELFRQFGQRLVTFDRGQRHLRLKRSPVISSRTLHCLTPLVSHPLVAGVKPGYHLPYCPNFRSPLWNSHSSNRIAKALAS